MFHDGFANFGEDLRRRILLGPLAIERQFAIRTKKQVHTDLPLAAASRVEMRRQMVRGVEPEIQALQVSRLYLSHARLDFIEPPEYEYTLYRTCWQSLALGRGPVLVNQRVRKRFHRLSLAAGEDQPKVAESIPAKRRGGRF